MKLIVFVLCRTLISILWVQSLFFVSSGFYWNWHNNKYLQSLCCFVQSLHNISLGYSLFQVIDLTSYKVLQWWDPSKTKGDAEVNCDCICWWNDWCLHWHVLYAGTFPMLPIHCHADWVPKRWFSCLLQTCAIWSFILARQYFSWSVFKVSFKDFVSC